VRELLPEVWQQVQGALDALGSLFMADEQAAVVAVLTPCISSLQLVQGWCFYRHKQYEEAFVFATSEPASQGKLELLAYLYAYSQSPYRNEKKLLEIVDQFPDKSVNGYNALVIAARDKGTSLVRDAVWNRLDQWVDQLNLNGATLEAAHLLHNLARLADEQGCFEKALAIIDKAIRAYGTESNWHHRGAAHFWRSKFLEKLGRPSDAWLAARDATAARAEQLRLEPANSVWKKDLEAARKHAWKVFSRVPLGATRFNPNPWPPLSS
jgi:tetratricopeptide (TPR) repeat protein